MCQRKKTICGSFKSALIDIKDLEPIQKKIIEERYICILETFETRAFYYAFLFHICRFIITVGSLIVPALLSIQYVDTGASSPMNPESFTFQIYWSTWVISLLVTTSNGIFTLFKVDKKYFLLHTILEQLRSEGWQFLQLSGRFSGFYTPNQKPTHSNQFLFFCHTIEKLKMKQVEEEYYKSTDTNLHGSTGQHANGHKQEQPDLEAGKGGVKNTIIPQVPAVFSDGLGPPTPLNYQLQQLLQALSVEGGNGSKQTNQETGTEMSVRSEVPIKSPGKEPLLRKASKALLAPESPNRLGTEVPAESLEQKPKAQENT